MPTIPDALRVAELVWPTFQERLGAVLLARAGGTDVASFPSLTEAEILLNHVHLLDEFAHEAAFDREPFWDRQHPDFAAAYALGRLLVDAWAARLSAAYPDRRFRVYLTTDDNPVIRFHQVRSGEPPYLDERDWRAAIADGSVVVRDVG